MSGVQTSRYTKVSLPTPSRSGGNSINSVVQPDSTWAQYQHPTACELGFLPYYEMDDAPDDEEGPKHELSVSTLPVEQDMISFFRFYRNQAHPFQYAIDDLDELEELISELVSGEQEVEKLDNHTLCLLHAVFAAGAQFSDLAPASRMLKSQREMKMALNYLGSSTLLWDPSKQMLQALIVLGHVLQNGMNPRAAWVLGGTTIRLALALGLGDDDYSKTADLSELEQCRLRLAIVRQDAFLSLALDQSPASQEMGLQSNLPSLFPPKDFVGFLEYQQTINSPSHLALQHAKSGTGSSDVTSLPAVFHDLDKITVVDQLQNIKACTSIQQLQQHYSFKLHQNFVVSTFSRSILRKDAAQIFPGSDYVRTMRRFITALKRSVRAFIKLQSISSIAIRTWALVHYGLSSALLLGLIKEESAADDTRRMQSELIEILTEHIEHGGRFSIVHNKAFKAIKRLRKLADQHAGLSPPNVRQSPETMGKLPDDLSEEEFQSIFFDDWLRHFNYNDFSPLESYGIIMAESMPVQFCFHP
ncbi:hypothetical protein FAVG1_02721 [Fusarium avenaceum]|nr:hypothetical protein FAVG1_02721 [Fusarium avenaceum]